MNNLKKQIFAILLFSVFTSNFVFSQNNTTILNNDDKTILRAMKDELARSMDKLQLESLKKPYFIEYQIVVSNTVSIQSAFGSITDSQKSKSAQATVGVRVGDYTFDNTNFFDVGLSFFGSGDDEERFKRRNIPTEFEYNSLRRELWLATDAAYKQSAEILSKKEATLKNRLRKDTTVDFVKYNASVKYNKSNFPEFPISKFENIAKSVSAVFLKYPSINASSFTIEYVPKTYYYVNSEGQEYIKTDYYAGMEMVASTQCEDGMPLHNYYTNYVNNPNSFPSQDSLINAAKGICNDLEASIKAQTLSESYSGPVLFSSSAAAEVFAQSFAPNLIAQRSTLTESGSQDPERYFAFQNKIGGRVLPEFLSLNSKPRLEKFANTELIGSNEMDDDGLDTKEINLVSNGYLKTLLTNRVPTRRLKESNASKRGGAPMYSILELETKQDKQLSYQLLKDSLISMIKARDLEFGIIIKKVLNQNIMYTTLYRVASGNVEFPRGEGNFLVCQAVKVDRNGKEEPVRGISASGFNTQSFKDILYTGKDKYALNLLAPSVIASFITGGDQFVPSSVIVPDLLFEDGEIKIMDDDFKKPPFLKNPIGLK